MSGQWPGTSTDEGVVDVAEILPARRPDDPGERLLTYYDDATGEHVDLSAAELGGWAARVGNLLVRGCGLHAGARACVLLPPHWQTAAVLLGAWSVGMSVEFRSWATAGLAEVGSGGDAPRDVSFVSRRRLESWLENVPDATHRFALGLDPLGAPMAQAPEGYQDFVVAVGGFEADPPPSVAIGAAAAASVDGTTHRQWGQLAKELAGGMGLRPGDRILVTADESEHPLKWLLVPLAAGASVVLCANPDRALLDSRIRSERVTTVM